jgi:signal transduction histidine kinase
MRAGAVELSVTDTGPGIPEADRARALERFVRLDSARTAQGAGIGLSLAAAVAELHGGRLELSDGAGDPLAPGLRAALILPGKT